MTDTSETIQTAAAPAMTGIHHFSPTVSDVEASAAWYERVFGMNRVPVPFPHYGAEEGGYAVLLMEPTPGPSTPPTRFPTRCWSSATPTTSSLSSSTWPADLVTQIMSQCD
jgi:catechol 2,3-dioxygenase-like lactoylglutathione lyase family enzyme